LCQVLAEQFRSTLQVALLTGRLSTRRALLQAILFELGLPYHGLEEGDLRLSLVDHLLPRGKANLQVAREDAAATAPAPGKTSPLLIIADEAHTLPLRLLEELRLITNLTRAGQPRVRLVLAGGPQLEERFASPKLESFNQRVAARCYLEAFDNQQTTDFVRTQIQQSGGQCDAIFTTDALEAIAHVTDGIPRLINQVCDHVLLLAYAGGQRQITAGGIEEAWADLQQLPMPSNVEEDPSGSVAANDVVEFGSLDESSSDDLPTALPFRVAGMSVAKTQPHFSMANSGRPLDSLEQITAHLAAIEDDFQPQRGPGPEVELIFPSSNPFHEVFDEEEVVIDRYTSSQQDVLANRPLVSSPESKELAAQLAAFGAVRMPAVGIAAATWPSGLPTERQSTADALPGVAQVAASSVGAGNSSVAIAENPIADATFSRQAGARVELPNVNDADLIVIEEPPDMRPSAPKKAAPRVRRQEYRQLFAQLRRG
jgi:type II secretory pathway predicted ATPase ExeA